MSQHSIIGLFLVMMLLLSSGGSATTDLNRQDSGFEGAEEDEQICIWEDEDGVVHYRCEEDKDDELWFDCRTEEVWSEEKKEWCSISMRGDEPCYIEDDFERNDVEVSVRNDTYCEPDYFPREPTYSPPQIIIIFIIIEENNFSIFDIEQILDLWGHDGEFINSSLLHPCNCSTDSCDCNGNNSTTNYTCDDDPLTDDCYEEEPETHPCNLPNATNCED
jgi:hypothetical protein|tara:strand:+ start:56357 stop:57013 length:657 start_codon:yes stop_codon:yes gene_type:complete